MGLFNRKKDSEKTRHLPQLKAWSAIRQFMGKEKRLPQSENNAHKQSPNREASSQEKSSESTAHQTCTLVPLGNRNNTPPDIACDSTTQLDPSAFPKYRLETPHNSTVKADMEDKELTLSRFQRWQHLRPRFQFGPHKRTGELGDVTGSSTSLDKDQQDGKINKEDHKYAYIFQNGTMIEREVKSWPKLKRINPVRRYRLLEPYASSYGMRYAQRIGKRPNPEMNYHRRIYESPIYLIPRRIVEENKRRLLIRHNFKNCIHEKANCGPQTTDLGTKEQARLVVKLQKNKQYDDASTCIENKCKQNKE